jgi:signal transduction histidine kinase
MKGCILRKQTSKTKELMEKMYSSDNDTMFYKITNPLYNTKTFLFGIRIGENYVFINSELESLDAANVVLKQQIIYLLIIVIILSVVLSYFVSKSITKPILDITKSAKKMGSGDLNVTFKPSNISEIDELAETLNYAKSEMVKTDDYRRDLMANVGHDLKTPLTLIKSYAEMVRDITYKDEEKRTANLNVIINESDRLNELVNDIIELSKLEANAEELNIEKYDLVSEIKDIISKFEILEMTENYNFIYNGVEEAIIKADKKKMGQVIYNLINNAINYTGEDQTVYINVNKIKNGYQVEVIDTGKGIDEETIKHVWDRYYKTEKKHKRNKVGTGLGLSIVREILQSHGFDYGVKSTLGKGTNFYFVVKK